MKLLSFFFLILIFSLTAVEGAENETMSDSDKFGYSLGFNIGNNLKRDSVDAQIETIIRGLRDGFQGKEGTLSREEMHAIVTSYAKVIAAKRAAEMKSTGEKNKQEGDLFLEENKKKPGVVTMPSGLQYRVLAAGAGTQPKESDTVTVHYRGMLPNGSEFDSSYKRGQPATFPISGVIPGWQEALRLMREGDKWLVTLPPSLAYGERGASAGIGPNQVMLFEMELLQVVPR